MIIVCTFRLIDRVLSSFVRRLGLDSRLGAWVAYWSGRIIFLQLRYVERIEKLSGWSPVQVETPPRIPYALYANGTVRHGFIGEAPTTSDSPTATATAEVTATLEATP